MVRSTPRPSKRAQKEVEIRHAGDLLRYAKQWREESKSLDDHKASLLDSLNRIVNSSRLSARGASECLRAAALLQPSDGVWTDVRVAVNELLLKREADFNGEDVLMLLTSLRASQTHKSDEMWLRCVALAKDRAELMDTTQRTRLRELLAGVAQSNASGGEADSICPMNGRDAAQLAIRMAKEKKRENGEDNDRVMVEFKKLKEWLVESEQARQSEIADIAHVARFLASVKEDSRPERQLFSAVCEFIISTEDVESMCSLVWALGRFRCRDSIADNVVNHIVKVILAKVDILEPKAISGVLFAFGKLGVWSTTLAEGVAARAVQLVPSMKGNDLSSTIWGYAVSDELNESLVMAVSEELVKRLSGNCPENLNLSEKDIFVCLWSLHTLLDELPDKLKPFYKKKTDSLISIIANSSESHRDLSRRLTTLGVRHVNEFEVQTGAGPLVVDIGLPDRRIALEVDGPWHAVRIIDKEPKMRYDGPTAWKRRMMRSAGWRVVPITTKEYELQRDKMLFLKRKLQEVL